MMLRGGRKDSKRSSLIESRYREGYLQIFDNFVVQRLHPPYLKAEEAQPILVRRFPSAPRDSKTRSEHFQLCNQKDELRI